MQVPGAKSRLAPGRTSPERGGPRTPGDGWSEPHEEATFRATAAYDPGLRTCPPMEEGTTTARLNPDATDRFLALRRELGVTSFGMNQIVLQPGQRGRIHRHLRQEEVYLVLEGTLTLALEGEAIELGHGELIRVAPEIRRQLVNRGPGRVVLLALGSAGEHQGRDGEAFGSWSDEHPVPPQELPLPANLEPGELRSLPANLAPGELRS
jgi:quercetin dioxygenase-like cupin family protein